MSISDASRLLEDPSTPAETLFEIAQRHPALRKRVAEHPNAYPGLIDWIREVGDGLAQADARSGEAESGANASPARIGQEIPSGDPNLFEQDPPDFSLKRRWVPWTIAFILIGALIITGALITLVTAANNTAAGKLGDGTLWGPKLGTTVAESKSFSPPRYNEGNLLFLSPDKSVLYALASDGVYILSSDNLEQLSFFPLDDDGMIPASMQMSPDGSRLYVASASSANETPAQLLILSVDGNDLHEAGRGELPGMETLLPTTMEISPDGATLYISGTSTVGGIIFPLLTVSTETATVTREDYIDGGGVLSLAVNPANGVLYVKNDNAEDSEQLEIQAREPSGLELLSSASAGSGYLNNTLYIAPDGSVLLDDAFSSLTVFDPQTLELRGTIDSRCGCAVGFVEGGQEYALWSAGALTLVDAESGAELTSIPTRDANGSIAGDIVIGNDSRHIFVTDSNGVLRIDTESERQSWGQHFTLLIPLLLVSIAICIVSAATAPRWVVALRRRQYAAFEKSATKAVDLHNRAAQQLQEQREAKEAEQQQAAEEEHAARVAAIQQWQQAYADANDGQAPPPGFIPPQALAQTMSSHRAESSHRTNTMAILAIIFGIGGGLLGIVFGHVALSQIRRTGEGGRGLAITGLVFGYVGLVAVTIYVIVAIVMFNSLSGM